jgi:hypothetical protein
MSLLNFLKIADFLGLSRFSFRYGKGRHLTEEEEKRVINQFKKELKEHVSRKD